MTKTLYLFLITMFLGVALHAQVQTIDEQKLDAFAHAVAKAEGFGVRGAIPTRYHNPGDLKTSKSFTWAGQVRIGKGGHVVFKNDAAGWAALKLQIRKAVSGQSRAYSANMTVQQVARKYAGNWRVWAKNVAHNLGVEPTTTLAAYLQEQDVLPPDIRVEVVLPVLISSPAVPVLAPQTERASLEYEF
jgi:hypothetical protein